MDIIAQEGMDEEEDEIPDDETINMVSYNSSLIRGQSKVILFSFQMLARSEEEFNVFQKMDNERIMKNAGKPKLMEESEILLKGDQPQPYYNLSDK